MRITTEKVSLHTMSSYLRTYQWLQTVALFRYYGYITGTFWAMMSKRLHNYYRSNQNICTYFLIHCLFICFSVHSHRPQWFPQADAYFPRSVANTCITTIINLAFRHCRLFSARTNTISATCTDCNRLIDRWQSKFKTVLFLGRIWGVKKLFSGIYSSVK